MGYNVVYIRKSTIFAPEFASEQFILRHLRLGVDWIWRRDEMVRKHAEASLVPSIIWVKENLIGNNEYALAA